VKRCEKYRRKLFSSIFSISFHYSTWVYSISFHYSAYFSSLDRENMEENSEMIWKIWKKDKSNSDTIWTIWKKGKLNSEKM
jgi:hypothetical protein